MKKIWNFLAIAAMLLSLVACGGNVSIPADSVFKKDLQEYITDVIDENAEISIFEKKMSEVDDSKLTVLCMAMYSSDAGDKTDEFTLTYVLKGKEWIVDKCRVNNKQTEKEPESIVQVESTVETLPMESEEPAESEPVEAESNVVEEPESSESEETVALTLSDDWKDFTFEMGGVVYQLPCDYSVFVENGWKLDENYKWNEIKEDTVMSGYGINSTYLTNGSVRIDADIVNLSGHAQLAKDCKIYGITLPANKNLGVVIAKGLTGASTKEEIEAALGYPTSSSIYDESGSLRYKLDNYNELEFYLNFEDATYNYISLENIVITEEDATVVSTERPAYLNNYVAPTVLGTEVTDTAVMLDGVVYQLPCPVEQFINNGWEVTGDSIGSLGAFCSESYGFYMTKNGVKLSFALVNYAEVEVYTSNCLVYKVDVDNYSMRNASEGFFKHASGLDMNSTWEEIEAVCENFEKYESEYYPSFTYKDDEWDYTEKIYVSWDKDGNKLNNITVEDWNWKWEY